MRVYCPNKKCGKDVNLQTNSRYNVFMCEECGFTFRGIHAWLNYKDYFWRTYVKFWESDESYSYVHFTPCPFCWKGLRLHPGIDALDRPDCICPKVCPYCTRDLPKSRIDEIDPSFLPPPEPEKVPDTAAAPLQNRETPVRIRKKKKPEPVDITFYKEKRKIFGAGIANLQFAFNDFYQDTSKKKDHPFNQTYERFQDSVKGEISMRNAFDMVRSLAPYQDAIGENFDEILELLVQDFQK